jgi:hypothetical protein
MCVRQLLRAICVLAVAGGLTDKQKQGVVVLMEGVCYDEDGATVITASGLHGHLLLEEPPQLKQDRAAAGLSLADVLRVVLWIQDPDLSSQPGCEAGALPTQLFQAFGEDQLPGVAAVHSIISSASPEEQAARRMVPSASKWFERHGTMDAYLSWVQATLLQVINEVLSQHVC